MKKIFTLFILFFLLFCVAFSQNQPSQIIVITNDNLDLILNGNCGVKWSGHCKKFQPVLENLAQHYNSDIENSKIKVAQVHCEGDDSICKKYNITGYPSLVFFDEGETKPYRGLREFDKIKEATDKHFK